MGFIFTLVIILLLSVIASLTASNVDENDLMSVTWIFFFASSIILYIFFDKIEAIFKKKTGRRLGGAD
jgi:predicted transporter